MTSVPTAPAAAPPTLLGRLDDLTRTADEIRARLRRAAEHVDQLDGSLNPTRRAQLVPALRTVWSIADELAAHASRFRADLVL